LVERRTKTTGNAASDWLERFSTQRFHTILADPPWQFQNRTGKMAPEHKRMNGKKSNHLKTHA
jgi:hypothetical protein